MDRMLAELVLAMTASEMAWEQVAKSPHKVELWTAFYDSLEDVKNLQWKLRNMNQPNPFAGDSVGFNLTQAN